MISDENLTNSVLDIYPTDHKYYGKKGKFDTYNKQ